MTAVCGEAQNSVVTDRPQVVVADAGSWSEEHINDVIADEHIQVLVPPHSGKRQAPRRVTAAAAA